MPRISILIPCLGDVLQFETTLASVLQNRPDDAEVLVVHNQPYHDPYALGREVCFIQVPEAARIATLLNAGCEASRSPIVHVVQCGLEVEEGWVEPALDAFAEESIGLVAPVVRDHASPTRVQAGGWHFTANGRCRLVGAGQNLAQLQRQGAEQITSPTLAAGFYRRALWRRLRFDPSLHDLLVPLAFGIAAQACGFEAKAEWTSVLHGCSPTTAQPDRSFGYAAARTAERLYWRAKAERSAWSQCAHLAWIMAEAIAAFPSRQLFTGLAGRIAGWASRSEAAAWRARVETIAQEIMLDREAANTPPKLVPYAKPTTRKVFPAPGNGKQRAA